MKFLITLHEEALNSVLYAPHLRMLISLASEGVLRINNQTYVERFFFQRALSYLQGFPQIV
jgi:hypothetical protein